MRIPPAIQEVAEVIGLENAIKITRAAKVHKSGHVRLYVPHTIRPGHALHDLLDEPERKLLAQTFGGCLMEYRTAQGLRRMRAAYNLRQAVKAMLSQGRATREIMATLGVSESYVCRLRKHGTSSSAIVRNKTRMLRLVSTHSHE